MRFDPFLFANICVGIAGVCYLLACAGFLYAHLWAWAGAYANYACANGFLIAIAFAAARRI
jgi:hypothetical protein